MNEQEQIRHYVHLFGALFSALGKWVGKVFILLIVFLILFQAALHIKGLRSYVSPVDKLDGVPVNEQNVKDWND